VRVALVEPEIPNNTGAIGRLCVAVGAPLELVHPLGFSLDEKARRRAGLDYWDRLDLTEHADWAAYRAAHPGATRWLLSARATQSVFDIEIRPGDHLVFGRESTGLPAAITDAEPERCVRLPMRPGERSLNVANAACAVVYEAIRQQIARGEVRLGEAGDLLGI